MTYLKNHQILLERGCYLLHKLRTDVDVEAIPNGCTAFCVHQCYVDLVLHSEIKQFFCFKALQQTVSVPVTTDIYTHRTLFYDRNVQL